ncbi:hypothetical protein [Paenibacillus pinihumi]|uniref:hypothetical protein n=1 Tax=Paenibacillus pinihumi TaxID=669462 RepID=UPI00042971BB|nr:hypothetical protein [Paenibacillus pinihumi]
MLSDEQLDAFRVQGTAVRVVRDHIEGNDVYGIVVAWNEEQVMIRKKSRRIVKLSRSYRYEPASEERSGPVE